MSTRRTIDIDIKNNADQTAKDFDNLSQATNRAATSVDNLDATFEQVYGELQPLTTRMGEAEDRLYELALAGDTTSKEYQELLTKVGEYRKVQIETDLTVDAAATTLSQKLGGAILGVSSGFAALQGIIGLVSTESEQLNKVLLRVQSSLALVQGIQGVREAVPAFQQLGKSAMTALKGIRTGIAATGVGLLVIAVGTLVAYWDDITAAISGVSDEQQALNAETEKNVLAAQENLKALNLQENSLRLQGKSEREILKLKMAATDEAIAESLIQIEQMEQTKKAQVEAAKRNKDIAQGIIAFLSAPIVILLGAVDALTSGLSKIGVLSEGTNLAQGFTEGAANLLFDPEETAAEADEEINVAKQALKQLQSDRDGFQLQIQAIDTNAAEKSVDTEKKRLNDIKKLQDDAFDKMVQEEKDLFLTFEQIRRENEDRLRTDEQNELLLVEEKYDKLEAMAQGNAEALNEIEIARLNEENDIKLEYAEKQKAIDDGIAANKAKNLEEDRIATLDGINKGLEMAEKGAAAIQALGDAVFAHKMKDVEKGSKEEEKLARKQFKFNKALQLGGAVIDAGKAITASLAAAPIAILGVPNPAGIASLAFAATTSAANIAKIAAAKFESPGSASSTPSPGGVGGGGEPQAPSFNVVGDSGVNQLAQLQQQPTQAFVVSGEVTTAQALDRNRVQNATL